MNTKYDVGEKVLVEGIIKNVKADCTGLVYGIEFCGKVHNFSEDQIYPIQQADKEIIIKTGSDEMGSLAIGRKVLKAVAEVQDDKSGIC